MLGTASITGGTALGLLAGTPAQEVQAAEPRVVRVATEADGAVAGETAYTDGTLIYSDRYEKNKVNDFKEGIWVRAKDDTISGDITIPAKISYNGTIKDVVGVACNGFSRKNITNVTIENGVQMIGEESFYYCTKLKTVSLPDTIIEFVYDSVFYDGVFEGCSSLGTINMPTHLKDISEFCFRGCSALKSVDIPPSVSVIKGYAFKDCTSLETVTLHDGLTRIRYNAFYNCTSLKSIHIPKTVTYDEYSIEEESFYGCKSLSDLTIEEGVKSIDEKAFQACPALKRVKIPSTIKEIGQYALGYRTKRDKTDGFTIVGYDGTAAQKYANDNGFKFESLGVAPSNGSTTNNSSSSSSSSGSRSSSSSSSSSSNSSTKSSSSSYYYSSSSKSDDDDDDDDSSGSVSFSKGDSWTAGKGASRADYVTTGSDTVRFESSLISDTATKATVPATVKIKGKKFKVTSIASKAFDDCPELKALTIGSNVRKIGKYAFKGAGKLRVLTINSKKLTKSGVKGSLSGSAVITLRVPVSKMESYKNIFTKANCGKKVKVTRK